VLADDGQDHRADPPPKTSVAGNTTPRWRNPVARYAGSITDTQHGAGNATTPPGNDTNGVLPTSKSPIAALTHSHSATLPTT
jgi:hypothetical protein